MRRMLQELEEEEFEGEEGEVRLCEEHGLQLWSSAMNLGESWRILENYLDLGLQRTAK